jgi:hypothetical protein
VITSSSTSVNGNDVRVAQLRRRPRLAQEEAQVMREAGRMHPVFS